MRTDVKLPGGPFPATGRRTYPRAGVQLLPACLAVCVAVVFAVVAISVVTIPVTSLISWGQVTEKPAVDRLSAFLFGPWDPSSSPHTSGIGGLLGTSLVVACLALAWAIPLSACSAVYLSEFASRRTRQAFHRILEGISLIPSLLYALFAIWVLLPRLEDRLPSMMAALLASSLALGILSLPYLTRLSIRALEEVSATVRDSAYALGSSRAEVVWRVVVPAAGIGLVRAWRLGLARLLGEALIVSLVTARAFGLDASWPSSSQTLGGALTLRATMTRVDPGPEAFGVFVTGLVLLVACLAIRGNTLRLPRRRRARQEEGPR